VRRVLLFAVLLTIAGCDQQSMEQQNRYDVYAPSKLWSNGSEAQPLPEGVVSQSDLDRAKAKGEPPAVTTSLMQTGQQHFETFCAPCHGLAGDGDGMIVQRGFPAPPSYHIERLRTAPAQHFFDVISNGYGVMYSYRSRVSPHDRWAIVAYIRALQASQDARVADVPQAKEKLP
jgi:mono/diheme cytochrome c family protein